MASTIEESPTPTPPYEDEKSAGSPDTSQISIEPEATFIPPSKLNWLLTCVGLFLGALLYGLDTTIAATVQASVYEDLGNIQKLSWIGIGFPLGSVAVILLIGKLFGTFEIKWLIIGSVTLFEAGSAICGAAPNSDALIFGRVIAGMGGAGMYIGALTYISVFTTPRHLPIYNALIGLSWGVGAILGPVIGGAFSDSSATWRWAFYINLPLAAIVSPVYFLCFPRYNPQPKSTNIEKLKKLDWAGVVLNAATFLLFIIVLTFQGSNWHWNVPGAIVLWVLFGISISLYAIQQTFSIFTTVDDRLFPVEFLKSRTMLLMYFATAAAAAGLSTTLYYIPLFFQFTKGDTALEACVRLLPFICVNIFAVMFSGGLLPAVGRYAPWYYISGILILVGGTLMYLVTETTKTAAIYGFEIMIAFGVGLIFQIGYAVASAKAPPNRVAASIGFINVAQIGSISITLAIAGSIFQNLGYVKLKHALQGYGFSEFDLRSALAGSASAVYGRSDPVIQQLAVKAVVETIAVNYALVISAGAVILVSAFCMRWEKLQLEVVAGG